MSETPHDRRSSNTYEQAKRAYRVASNANRLYKLWNWLGFSQMSAGNIAAAVGAAGVVGAGVGMMVNDIIDPRARIADASPVAAGTARPQSAETTRWDDNTIVFRISGFDKGGRQASFDVLVLVKEYAWVKGSVGELQRNGAVLSGQQVLDAAFSSAVRQGLSHASEIIAVGIASQEGEAVAEELRARRRAEQTAAWVLVALGGQKAISTLSLGRYRETCARCETMDTSWQRPFMVIGVRERQTGVVIAEALADAMAGRDNLPSPERYSSFILERVR